MDFAKYIKDTEEEVTGHSHADGSFHHGPHDDSPPPTDVRKAKLPTDVPKIEIRPAVPKPKEEQPKVQPKILYTSGASTLNL